MQSRPRTTERRTEPRLEAKQKSNTNNTMKANIQLDPMHDAITYGTHAGAKIPALILRRTDWFLWSLNERSLVRSFDEEKLQALFTKATRIAVSDGMVADYYSTATEGLVAVKLRRADESAKIPTSGTLVTKNVLDLAHDFYAYRGCRRPVFDPVLDVVIDRHFGGSRANVTEEAAKNFFSDDSNFALATRPL
jgi:hypothetical protein